MKRAWILGCPVDLMPVGTIVPMVESALHGTDRLRIVTLNPEMIVKAQKDAALAHAIKTAGVVVPDGIGVVLAIRSRGLRIRRIPGVELAERLMESLASRGGRLFLLGGRPGIAEQAAARLRTRFPGLVVVGVHHGYFDDDQDEAIAQAIRDLKPQMLLVGMGVPRQETWLTRYWELMNVPVAMGIGGGLDLWAGVAKRAPTWVRGIGLEWLYRALCEPQRLRRLGVIPVFILQTLRERKGEGGSCVRSKG